MRESNNSLIINNTIDKNNYQRAIQQQEELTLNETILENKKLTNEIHGNSHAIAEAAEAARLQAIAEAAEAARLQAIAEAEEAARLQAIAEAAEAARLQAISEAAEAARLQALAEAAEAARLQAITITPSSSFVMKCSSSLDGLKVFVNICQHELIIPNTIMVSACSPYTVSDKGGDTCTCFTVAVNSNYVPLDSDTSGRNAVRFLLLPLLV